MKPQAVIAAWLNDSSITDLVGTRKALGQLPDGTTYPALVYQIITGSPKPWVDYNHKPQLATFRVQINPLATTIGQLDQISQALSDLLHMRHQVTVGSYQVMSSKQESVGAVERDNDAGIWTQPLDFVIWYYE